jgi:ATP-dependent Clp protease ATP-binding subunit ClpC
VHTLVGAGSVGRGGGGGGGLDISNLIKPALARGELQCIGATTVDEHRKYIEKDPALER